MFSAFSLVEIFSISFQFDAIFFSTRSIEVNAIVAIVKWFQYLIIKLFDAFWDLGFLLNYFVWIQSSFFDN